MVNKIVKSVVGLIHIQFSDVEVGKLSLAELRRIRMVNYVGVITISTMISYVILYQFLDYKLFKPSIVFLLISSFLVVPVMIVNKLGYHNSSKVLMSFLNSFFMAVTTFYFFGYEPGFHVFLLLSAFIPLFFWPLSRPLFIIIFLLLNYGVYIIAEFLSPILNPIVNLPQEYIELFRGSNVLVCFFGAAVAIVFYTVLATKKEDDLVKKTVELEDSQRHQNLVYSVIAHDLRSPLKGVISLTSLLSSDNKKLNEVKMAEMIDVIFKSSKSLDSLLENLLDWSKLKSGMHTINQQFFQLNRIIDVAMKLLKDLAQDKNIDVISMVDMNDKVYADAYMVSTVIRNLLVNAIKFTPIDGKVQISTTRLDKTLRVCVEDTGIGIPLEHLKNLFDLSSLYTNLGTNSEKGSGLGLKICGDFIKINGGKIWAESELNKGSRFYFTLQLSNNQ